MLLGDKSLGQPTAPFETDALDLRILELLAGEGGLTYRQLSSKLGVDKRTVAKHFEAMRKEGVVKITAEIDWPRIGVNAFAFVGTMTALGEEDVAKLYEYIRSEARVIEAYSTLGSDEYFLVVLDKDLQTLREEVLRRLEPLTADLSTAIVSRRIKQKDYAAFLSFLRQKGSPAKGSRRPGGKTTRT